ncbi:hypothetical protein HCN44_004715 [Aphidius gifuensis]|uniref:Calpain catalytic domain-containing protein n=1 Tax=Aphidius gifuensis TaxID=684658 RepID=A0A834XZT4_APHGI|nr:hypothetical protein HCN44_004715 [Aphidius gifuensis]
MIEFQQQDFDDLKKHAFISNTKFEDDQFLVEPLTVSYQLLRPTEIVDDPVFFLQQNNKRFHVKQGMLGNCWFVVGLVHLQNYPNLFKFIVQPNDQTFHAGIFHFRFWQAGTWVDVVIDDRLPTTERKLVYASSGYPNEFWPALIEKAYAKLLYRSYEKLKGGFSRISMQDFSGGISELVLVDDKLLDTFDFAKKTPTMLSASTDNKAHTTEFGLEIFHAYAITEVKEVTGININNKLILLRIYNPHGQSSNRYFGNIKHIISKETIRSQLKIGVDGESWILYNDFIKHFEFLEICNLTPNLLIGDVYYRSNKVQIKLLLSEIKGKFMGGTNSKEITYNFFKINPQYRVVLTKRDQGNARCKILIGVSLKRRHDLEQVSETLIYFYIFSVFDDEIIGVPKPLSSCGKTCIKIGPLGAKGQVSAHFSLQVGTYYIIPFVERTFKGANFHLQILSEHDNILEVYDRDIKMPQMNKKLKNLLTNTNLNEIDLELYLKITSDLTINFKDLYNILKNDKLSLNKNCYIAQELDDTFVLDLELLAKKILVPQRKLSYLTIAKTILITQEVIENYGEEDFPGYIKTNFILTVLKRNGYFINMNIYNAIYTLFKNPDGLVHLNDFMLIVFAIKNKFGNSSSEDEQEKWVEKSSSKEQNQPLEREEWMNLSRFEARGTDLTGRIISWNNSMLVTYGWNWQIMANYLVESTSQNTTAPFNLTKKIPGTISITLYLTDAEVQYFIDYIRSSDNLHKRKNIAYLIVYKDGEFYPINYLRNIGTSELSTSFIFQVDVDFLLQHNLYENLISYIIKLNLSETNNTALIVPAFETQRYRQ